MFFLKTGYIISSKETKNSWRSYKEKIMTNCETSAYVYFDENTGGAVYVVDVDEDELLRLSQIRSKDCPYYKDGDEYKNVRHQVE